MDDNKLKTIDGWIKKASNKLNAARDLIKTGTQYSEVIQASQESIEFSVKSVLSLLEIDFSPKHGWDLNSNQLTEMIKKIHSKNINKLLANKYLENVVRLPRLLFLINFWSQFYIASKYGISKEYFASAEELFEKAESELSIKHAEECYWAVTNLRHKLFL